MGEKPQGAKITPADWVIKMFGGTIKTSEITGIPASYISAWKRGKDRGGCGGKIPRSAQEVILLKAKALGIDITAEDLILGRAL